MGSENTIDSSRFLTIVSDPLEATYEETITFNAVVTESNGELFTGPAEWSISPEIASLDTPGKIELTQDPNEVVSWKVPKKSEFTSLFGPMEKSGKLLRINAAVGGRSAYKRFVVSERSPEDRAKTAGTNCENASSESSMSSSSGDMAVLTETDGPTHGKYSIVIFDARAEGFQLILPRHFSRPPRY